MRPRFAGARRAQGGTPSDRTVGDVYTSGSAMGLGGSRIARWSCAVRQSEGWGPHAVACPCGPPLFRLTAPLSRANAQDSPHHGLACMACSSGPASRLPQPVKSPPSNGGVVEGTGWEGREGRSLQLQTPTALSLSHPKRGPRASFRTRLFLNHHRPTGCVLHFTFHFTRRR